MERIRPAGPLTLARYYAGACRGAHLEGDRPQSRGAIEGPCDLKEDPVDTIQSAFNRFDTAFTRWMADNGVRLLRISLGIVFFWFGVLKFFPGFSPASDLAAQTIHSLTFGVVPSNIALLVLATWECLIGLGLILGVFLRATLLLLWVQMLGTITPLFLFPELAFTRIPYAPTLEGQYIIKNIVLISAGLVIGATVRGGRMISTPAGTVPGDKAA